MMLVKSILAYTIASIANNSNIHDIYLIAKQEHEQLHKQHICLAETIYYEARGDSLIGKEAVADVVLNRVNHKVFPNSICEVVYQKNQFSWTANKYAIREMEAWQESKDIAWRKLQDELNGTRKDASQSATFFSTGYHHKNTVKIGKIGGYHVFFKLK